MVGWLVVVVWVFAVVAMISCEFLFVFFQKPGYCAEQTGSPAIQLHGAYITVNVHITELPTVTFWPCFDTVTLKMYGNMVC